MRRIGVAVAAHYVARLVLPLVAERVLDMTPAEVVDIRALCVGERPQQSTNYLDKKCFPFSSLDKSNIPDILAKL